MVARPAKATYAIDTAIDILWWPEYVELMRHIPSFDPQKHARSTLWNDT